MEKRIKSLKKQSCTIHAFQKILIWLGFGFLSLLLFSAIDKEWGFVLGFVSAIYFLLSMYVENIDIEIDKLNTQIEVAKLSKVVH